LGGGGACLQEKLVRIMHEEQIVAHLVKKYHPLGIILHGSRAGNYATQHSDWDFFVFSAKKITNKRRNEQLVIEKEFIDIMIWQFPIANGDLKKYFAKYCGIAKLVYCANPLVSNMFLKIQKIHNQGLHLSSKEIARANKEIEKSLGRLYDWVNDDLGVFFLRSSDIYQTLYNYWWNIKNHAYSISPRQGLSIIKRKDKKFFHLLQIISSNTNNLKKYRSLLKAKNDIFR
jgi:predicted nucleotidyltransferase